MIRAIIALFRWAISLAWTCAKKQPIAWGIKLQELNKVFEKLITSIFKINIQPDAPQPNMPQQRFKLLVFLQRLRRRRR